MSFKDIKNQSEAIAFLKSSISGGRIASAYIFLGICGIGKKLTALNFAKAINCVSLTLPEEKPCDACISCKKIDSANHPDVFLIEQEKEGKAIGIDRVREVIRSISLKPYEANKKVYIIDGADNMTREAANAFLKTLEEPPAGSVLILITEKLSGLLPTIVSRSQIVKFFPLAPGELKNILVNAHKFDDGIAHIVSRLSGGSLGGALKLSGEGFLRKRSGILDSLAARRLLDSDLEGVGRNDLKLCLDVILTWYRDILLAKTGTGPDGLINIDRKDAILKEASRLDFEHIDALIRRTVSTAAFLDHNANQKLAIATLALAADR